MSGGEANVLMPTVMPTIPRKIVTAQVRRGLAKRCQSQ
jgi:hypothetical protein